jgi:hypothetical protein
MFRMMIAVMIAVMIAPNGGRNDAVAECHCVWYSQGGYGCGAFRAAGSPEESCQGYRGAAPYGESSRRE